MASSTTRPRADGTARLAYIDSERRHQQDDRITTLAAAVRVNPATFRRALAGHGWKLADDPTSDVTPATIAP